MAATKGGQYHEAFRNRIKASLLANRLQAHALGQEEMTATQIRAAEILLKKVVADLSSVEHSGEVTTRHAHEFSDAELAAIASRSGDPVAPASGDPSQSEDLVH